MTETSFETPLVVSRYLPSGVNAICQTRWPTSRYFFTFLVCGVDDRDAIGRTERDEGGLPSG